MSKRLPILLLPAIAVAVAMLVTGFPFLPEPGNPYRDYLRFEIRAQQIAAISTALVASLTIIATCKPHIAWLMVIASHVLWVHPIWGFHHDSSLGIFAWLFLGGEEGFFVFPNPLGIPLSLAAHLGVKRMLEFSVNDASKPKSGR